MKKIFRLLLAHVFLRWQKKLVEDEKTQKLSLSEPLPSDPQTENVQWPVNGAPRNVSLEETFPYHRLHPAQSDPVTPFPIGYPPSLEKQPTGAIMRQYRQSLKKQRGLVSGPLTEMHHMMHPLPDLADFSLSLKTPAAPPTFKQPEQDDAWLC